MLTAQDMTYDEARNLHSKWLKHQAFMAELQSNKEWLDKIDKVGQRCRCVAQSRHVCCTAAEDVEPSEKMIGVQKIQLQDDTF